jgi:hypothetical protein
LTLYAYDVLYWELDESSRIADIAEVDILAVPIEDDTDPEQLIPCFRPFDEGNVLSPPSMC